MSFLSCIINGSSMRFASASVVFFILLKSHILCELLEDKLLESLFEFNGVHLEKIKPSKQCSKDKKEEMTTVSTANDFRSPFYEN